MRRRTWGPSATAAVLVVAIAAFGLAVQFVLVHVPPAWTPPPMCTLTSDFWRGDEVLC